ncbi:MAG: hypothetical protein LBK71_04095 [Verrucomicrobiales bacterium]|jgi:Arc/MetJ-type ribon-helix-helix transcriptional regulator|nr:hypothetical protein [Verrucomicrobiales bacterium]MDR1305570.1 hypothetical protein [Verrucomicrobiales bacterium]
MASAEINIRFSRDLMREVMRHCQHSGHSSRMFIEEAVRALLEQIDADGATIPAPALAVMVRKKLGKQTRSLEETVSALVEENLARRASGTKSADRRA